MSTSSSSFAKRLEAIKSTSLAREKRGSSTKDIWLNARCVQFAFGEEKRLIREAVRFQTKRERKRGKLATLCQKGTMAENRKMIFLAVAHALATLIIWQHFFYVKYRVQEAKVPDEANLYWWKRLTPPIEFGAMHAILFQMALLPLTMARQTVAALSNTYIGRKFVPLHKVVAMHVHLGYVMCGFVFAATIIFFAFFGQGCAQQRSGKEPSPNGVRTFCKKMTSEIMATGLAITGCLILVAVTSYMRNRIKYEIFYYVHHLVFVMFSLAIAHTLDDKFRRGQVRSQNFKWFSASLLWYLTDRFQASFSTRECDVEECKVFGDDSDESRKVVKLRLTRPVTFVFRPGQYVFIAIKTIDLHWHPFSIASDPREETIDIYVEVMSTSKVDGSDSWTHKLWRDARDGLVTKVSINGPYGSGFNDISDRTQILGIGSGTGIVPMLSLLKSHMNPLLLGEPAMHLRARAETDAANRRFAEEYSKESRYVAQPLVNLASAVFHGGRKQIVDIPQIFADGKVALVGIQTRWRRKQLEKKTDNPTKKFFEKKFRRSMFFEAWQVVQIAFPLLDLAAVGLLISFYVNEGIATQAMREVPLWILLVNLVYNFIKWCFETINEPLWYTDMLFTMTSALSFGFWYRIVHDERRLWTGYAVWGYAALSVYRACRTLSGVSLTCKAESGAVSSFLAKTGQDKNITEKLTIVMITPQADFCAVIWNDLNETYEKAYKVYGKSLSKFIEIQVYCTNKDATETDELLRTTSATTLGKSGALRLHRPDFEALTQAPLMTQVTRDYWEGRPKFTSSVVIFCGSTRLGSTISNAIFNAKMRFKVFIGSNHVLDFIQENYGQATPMKSRGVSATIREVKTV
jgi:predicted ferric reductase